MAKANQIIHLERDTVLIPRRPAQLSLLSRLGKTSLYTHFKPNVAKHPAAFHIGPCVINARGTPMWDYYKGGGLAKGKLLRLGERNTGSVLVLPLAVWPQTSTCPSLGLSPPRSAVFKLGGRALEF